MNIHDELVRINRELPEPKFPPEFNHYAAVPLVAEWKAIRNKALLSVCAELLRSCRGVMETEGFDAEVADIDATLAAMKATA